MGNDDKIIYPNFPDFLRRRKVDPLKADLMTDIGELMDRNKYSELHVDDIIYVLAHVMVWKGGEVWTNGLSLVKMLCSVIHSGAAADWGGEEFVEWFTKGVPRYEPDFEFEWYDGDDEDDEDD